MYAFSLTFAACSRDTRSTVIIHFYTAISCNLYPLQNHPDGDIITQEDRNTIKGNIVNVMVCSPQIVQRQVLLLTTCLQLAYNLFHFFFTSSSLVFSCLHNLFSLTYDFAFTSSSLYYHFIFTLLPLHLLFFSLPFSSFITSFNLLIFFSLPYNFFFTFSSLPYYIPCMIYTFHLFSFHASFLFMMPT